MKRLVLLFAALLVAGCGEKRSPEGSDSTGESAEPSADTAQAADDRLTLPFSDADIERLIKEAVEFNSLQERNGLLSQANESEPYSGWVKSMYDSGQVEGLTQFKDGKPDGLQTWWHVNGQKAYEETFKDGKQNGLMRMWHKNGRKKTEGTFKDGKLDGLLTGWYENGQKMNEGVLKDGEEISARYWNSIGEEVEAPSDSGKKSDLEQAVGIESLESKGEEVETPQE